MGRPRTMYDTRDWRAARAATLKRDGLVCRLRFKCCRGRANSADHITRPEDGGSHYDLSNLRAACAPCNTARRKSLVAARGSTC